jgi:uncharacterized membrane protein SpoIIM required for sporulation
MAEIRLRSADFRRERERQWKRLNVLVERVERRGLKSLTTEELHSLPSLYRAAVSSLSVARAISLDRNVLEFLESLVTRAYFCVYGVKPRTRAVLGSFFTRTFPAAVRRHAAGILLAAAMMAAGLAVGLASTDPETYFAIMPASMHQGRTPMSTTEELREVLYSRGQPGESGLAFFATYLFTHNAQVGFFSFALGFALGVPSVILLLYNGLILGVLAELYHSRGLGGEFWAWVLPHGVTELLAICLCGGAGLHLAFAIIRPGRFGRLHALREAGRDAALVVLGAVLMFLIAGLIEGFFRQLVHSVGVRYTVAFATLAFWVGYFGWCGRKPAGLGEGGAP